MLRQITILFSLFMLSPFIFADEAYFCEECVSSSTAQQIAKTRYSPRLKCHAPDPSTPMTPDNAVCGSISRSIILVNPNTNAVYSYEVGHSNQAPLYPVQAWNNVLSQQAIEGYSKVAEYFLVYENGLKLATSAALSSTSLSKVTSLSPASNTASCPTDTALSTLVDPNKMAALEDKMTLAIMLGIKGSPGHSVLDDINHSGRISNVGASVTYRGANYNTAWSDSTKKPMIAWPFSNSETNKSIKDFLLFSVDKLRNDPNNIPILRYTLNDDSRIAGMKISQLKGTHGPLEITNPCVLDKLAQLNLSGEFRNAGGEAVEFNGSTSAGSAGGGSTCTIYFYQSGRLLYMFRLPMSQC
jgi:hypothetical protein